MSQTTGDESRPADTAGNWREVVHSERFSDSHARHQADRRWWRWRYFWLVMRRISPLLLIAAVLALALSIFVVVGLFVRPIPGWPDPVFGAAPHSSVSPAGGSSTNARHPAPGAPSASATAGPSAAGGTAVGVPSTGSGGSSGAATSSGGAQSGVPLPTVAVPTISLPPVSLPPVTLPPVTIPILPPITVPPVSVPPIAVPPISLPTLPLPTLPLGLP